MKRYFYYFWYVLRHKWYVFFAGLSMNVPIWRLLIHDWDKFLPQMFIPYAKQFRNLDGTRPDPLPEPTMKFKQAVLSHVNRHKHHWQYWVFHNGAGDVEYLKVPDVFRREMLADWMGAGKALGKPDITDWYLHHREDILLHDETKQWVDTQIKAKVLEIPISAASYGVFRNFILRNGFCRTQLAAS